MIYDDMVRRYGDPGKAPEPEPLTIRDWQRERRRLRVAQEVLLGEVVQRSNGVPAPAEAMARHMRDS